MNHIPALQCPRVYSNMTWERKTDKQMGMGCIKEEVKNMAFVIPCYCTDANCINCSNVRNNSVRAIHIKYIHKKSVVREFIIEKTLLKGLVKEGLWDKSMRQNAANGSVQNIEEVPEALKQLYKTAKFLKNQLLNKPRRGFPAVESVT